MGWGGMVLWDCFRRWTLNVEGGPECSIGRLLELFDCDAESPTKLPPAHFSRNLFQVARQGPSSRVIGSKIDPYKGPIKC